MDASSFVYSEPKQRSNLGRLNRNDHEIVFQVTLDLVMYMYKVMWLDLPECKEQVANHQLAGVNTMFFAVT